MAVPSKQSKMKHRFMTVNAIAMKKLKGEHETTMTPEEKKKELLALMERMRNTNK